MATDPKLQPPDPASLREWLKKKLLAWFSEQQREVPWRRDRDPYRIWISEVMLQQTQVTTVIPFFERFVAAFPNIQSLAKAEEQQVLRLWSGLGYYRRARFLHQAAKQMVEKHEGRFPSSPNALQSLPGMGRYTVNAILSQAFEQRLPILEANSIRVLCRLFGQKEDPRREPLKGWLWKAAEDILPLRKHIGDFNQALMELGALVCAPTNPKCKECPLRRKCLARQYGLQEQIPLKAIAPETVKVQEVAVVIWKRKKVLLAQRSESASRWATMWECPHTEIKEGESHSDAAGRLLADLNLNGSLHEEIITIRHGVTHYDITMKCLSVQWNAGKPAPGLWSRYKWLSLEDLPNYPVSSPQKKLIRSLRQHASDSKSQSQEQ